MVSVATLTNWDAPGACRQRASLSISPSLSFVLAIDFWLLTLSEDHATAAH